MVMAEAVRSDSGKISRREVQQAIAKSVELRALHASLMQGNNHNHNRSPAHLKLLSASPPLSHPSSHFSAHDYPVFNPSYEEEPIPISGHIRMASQLTPEDWNDNNLRGENQSEHQDDASSRKGLPEHHRICPADDTKSVASSCTNHVAFRLTSPGTDMLKLKGASLDDSKSVSSCNQCKPATISADHSKTGMLFTDSHSVNNASQGKSRGMILSWFFPRSKRRQKNEGGSPLRPESEEVSQVLNGMGLGIVSAETLKKELIEATQKRDAAVMEASEMKFSFGELKKKLQYLELHCEELKKALLNLSKTEKLGGQSTADSLMPVTEEVMVEGFLQIVAEARLAMKQFCKALLRQIEEKDEQLMKNLNMLLKPYRLSFNSKHPKAVFYHLAAIINQAFYQDFENCVFQQNGTPKSLDPTKERQQKFQSFVALRNLSWNEVLKKGTKCYSEEFSNFCDQKMNCIVVTLNWTRAWPEALLQSFFIAAKCVWLLHLLAFAFYPPLIILRVEENRPFDAHYMEDVFKDKQKGEVPSRVKAMVMPGFYVQDQILRCKVLCRNRSAA